MEYWFRGRARGVLDYGVLPSQTWTGVLDYGVLPYQTWTRVLDYGVLPSQTRTEVQDYGVLAIWSASWSTRLWPQIILDPCQVTGTPRG